MHNQSHTPGTTTLRLVLGHDLAHLVVELDRLDRLLARLDTDPILSLKGDSRP